MSILLGHGSQCPVHLLPSRGACARCGVFLCETCPPGRFCLGCEEKVRFLQGRGSNEVAAPGRLMAATGVLSFCLSPVMAASLTGRRGEGSAWAGLSEEWILLGLVVLPFLSSGVLTAAGLQMARNRSYRLALTGAVLAILPVTGLCWIHSVGVGLWALVVLRRAEVRALFDAERERLEGGGA